MTHLEFFFGQVSFAELNRCALIRIHCTYIGFETLTLVILDAGVH